MKDKNDGSFFEDCFNFTLRKMCHIITRFLFKILLFSGVREKPSFPKETNFKRN